VRCENFSSSVRAVPNVDYQYCYLVVCYTYVCVSDVIIKESWLNANSQ
jgi:hypothetical protein